MRVCVSIHLRRGLTLIELLVSVAIIGLIVALILPACKKVMATARQATCTSYERQIGSALFLYAGDNNNTLPPVAVDNANEFTMWHRAIWTYCGYSASSFVYNANDQCVRNRSVTQKNIFRCPEIWGNPTCPPNVTINPNRMSYGLNSAVGGNANWSGPSNNVWTTPVGLSWIVSPAGTAMVMETSFALGGNGGFRNYWGLIPHNGGLNVLFYDGHVQYMKLAEIPAASSDRFWSGQ